MSLITEQQLREMIGSEQQRNLAVKRALEGRRASYGWIQLVLEEEQLLEVQSSIFNTIINIDRVQQTEDGPSIKALGEKLDEIIIEELNEFLTEKLWNQ